MVIVRVLVLHLCSMWVASRRKLARVGGRNYWTYALYTRMVFV